MPATNTATESALPATVTRYVGVCQICEAEHKLTTDAFPSLGIFGQQHKVVHHGYRRPGHGSIEGDCAGVGEVPFEISCEATKKYRGSVALSHRWRGTRKAKMKTSTDITLTMVAIDPVTRLHLREATTEEATAYWANNPPAPFDRPVRVGDVVIDTCTGPGGSHIPGRFLP